MNKALRFFIVTSDGYLKPTEITIKYYNSFDNGQSFILFFRPLTNIYFQEMNSNYSASQTMVFISDTACGRIMDINIRVRELLNLSP